MIQDIKITQIQPGDNYRKHMDKAGMKELTASVKSHGVLQPIIVRKVGKTYEVIAGHRRHSAAIAAGLKTIPASIITADDNLALEIAVIENSQREDPNPMDEAIGFKKLLDLGKHTPETLAKKLDKSISYVYGRLKLNELPKIVQKALFTEEISYGHALVLTRFNNEKDIKEMLESILEQDMSVKQTADGLRDYSTSLNAAAFGKAECETCQSRTRNQSVLFPEDKDTDDCLDTVCYGNKTSTHYKQFCDRLKEDGFDIVTEADKAHKLIYQDRKVDRIFIAPFEWGTKPKDKNKCQQCKTRSFVCVEQKKYHGRLSYMTGWVCMEKKCLDVMNGTWVEPVKKLRNADCGMRNEVQEQVADSSPLPSEGEAGERGDDQSGIEAVSPHPTVRIERDEEGKALAFCPSCSCMMMIDETSEGE